MKLSAIAIEQQAKGWDLFRQPQSSITEINTLHLLIGTLIEKIETAVRHTVRQDLPLTWGV